MLLTLLVLGHVLPPSANASDGVLEINQVCAEQTGCFPGDPAGFPVEITPSTPGRSFRLTSDLTNPSTSLNTIAITTGPISLDLAGFRVSGPASCTFGAFGVACANTGNGVLIAGLSAVGVSLHGGSVIGAPGASITLGALSAVTDVIVSSAGSDGITVGGGSRVERCTVADVLGNGIRADQSLVSDTMIYEPRLSGVVNANSTYLTAVRNVQVMRWGIPVFVPAFVNTLSTGTNLCNGSAC
jgi:hypothetical protein